ncbi:MAG: polysaccharide deacetylase family protein [bacterium]|nr:polysaccharide deacetylase family protein [bacterium]
MTVVLVVSSIIVLLICFGLLPHFWKKLAERRLARVCRATHSLVLSYDDGPNPVLTPQLLDLLAEFGVRASFFAMGRSVPGNEALLSRIVAEGHELGSHSQQHYNAWRSLPSVAVEDIRNGYRTLSPWIPSNAPFRPPYGKMTLASWWEVKKRGASLGWWTIVAGDTDRVRRPPEEVSRDLLAASGGVVLMHDLDREAERNEWVLAATRSVLTTAREEGYRVCTLGELLSQEGV